MMMCKQHAGGYCIFVQILDSVAPQNYFYLDNSSKISKKKKSPIFTDIYKEDLRSLTLGGKTQIREQNRPGNQNQQWFDGSNDGKKVCKIQQSERVRKNSPVYLSIPVSLIRIKSTISPIFLLCSTNIHFKHVSLTAALNLSWKKTDFTYPSTSFSGATALVTFSVFIGLMESRGSCTMRP